MALIYIYYNTTKAIQSCCECLFANEYSRHTLLQDTYIRNHIDFTKTNTPALQMCVLMHTHIPTKTKCLNNRQIMYSFSFSFSLLLLYQTFLITMLIKPLESWGESTTTVFLCSRQSSVDLRRLRWLVYGLTNKSSVSVCKQKISSVFSRSAILSRMFLRLFTNKQNLGRTTF